MTCYLYVVKGWPVIVYEGERARYTNHDYVGAFQDPQEMVRKHDELVERALGAISARASSAGASTSPVTLRRPK